MFQFPSNGKAYPKWIRGFRPRQLNPRFNSLQTGKPIQSSKIMFTTLREGLSFNSLQTGKPIQRHIWRLTGVNIQVSIPFKRESLSKVHHDGYVGKGNIEGFNSLQTGKPIQRRALKEPVKKEIKNWVSIPFKRESLSKGVPSTFIRTSYWVSIPFKRESLSKAQLLTYEEKQQFERVSIPFKRESLSKDWAVRYLHLIMWVGFNSLQTGKPIQRLSSSSTSGDLMFFVSIPFKRESLSKVNVYLIKSDASESFNSLQTGKPIQSVGLDLDKQHLFTLFVSIPFKRESLSKVWFRATKTLRLNCFNSLQTGKPIQSLMAGMYINYESFCFNSLQTGKPIQSSYQDFRPILRETRFNSLQTGKPIQRYEYVVIHNLDARFNSLQTGKPIQRVYRHPALNPYCVFQFPSNGKAYPKQSTRTSVAPSLSLFQFPSNGKAYPKCIFFTQTQLEERYRFNSLQTGKPIQSCSDSKKGRSAIKVSIPFKRESLSKEINLIAVCHQQPLVSIPFKRESLSKVDHTIAEISTHNELVSIPFKRESLSKDGYGSNESMVVKKCFNSLQTGKPIQSLKVRVTYAPKFSFNSLQTGKPIQRGSNATEVENTSTGFNSLQTGKPIQSSTFSGRLLTQRQSFNSLQTGKPIQSGKFIPRELRVHDVSIPFKRESLSKVWGNPINPPFKTSIVSIPFKRESLSKGGTGGIGNVAGSVSIPFKRESLSKGTWTPRYNRTLRVSIPFKRESLSKGKEKDGGTLRIQVSVSIPFKRESLSKGEYSPWTTPPRHRVSIPFKRESLSKESGIIRPSSSSSLFQFPSNGKAYPKNLWVSKIWDN